MLSNTVLQFLPIEVINIILDKKSELNHENNNVSFELTNNRKMKVKISEDFCERLNKINIFKMNNKPKNVCINLFNSISEQYEITPQPFSAVIKNAKIVNYSENYYYIDFSTNQYYKNNVLGWILINKNNESFNLGFYINNRTNHSYDYNFNRKYDPSRIIYYNMENYKLYNTISIIVTSVIYLTASEHAGIIL